MTTTQDVEQRQIPSNFPGPAASQNPGTVTQITQSQGSPSELRVGVTVLRAHNIPRIKNFFGLKLFVAVTNQTTKKKTSSVATSGSTAQWNENLDAFVVQPTSRLIFRLYGDRFARRDVLIGSHEMMIPVESQTGPLLFINLAYSTS
ncbi:hypothetical protein V8E53_003832 [Lactarius tabidus]